MAVRLQMKLGVVAEHDRLPDSPDTIVVVEPSVGLRRPLEGPALPARHVAHQLAPRAGGHPARRRDHPQRVLLRRVGRDPRLPPEGDRDREQAARPPGRPARPEVHRRERPDRRRGRRGPRQRDVRGDGRSGRGLPDPPGPPLDAPRPAPRARPAVGRARARRLARRDLGRRLARARLAERRRQARPRRAQGRDAHAPSAVGDGAPPPPVRRRRRRRAATARSRSRPPRSRPRPAVASPVPVKPAGAAGRRPGPLADPARRQRPGRRGGGQRRRRERPGRGRRRVRPGRRAGSRTCMPRRKPAYRRVTPLASRRETQRRAALALLALRRGRRRPRARRLRLRRDRQAGRRISSVNAGQAALDKAREDLAKVKGPGIDLVAADPGEAKTLLTEAYQQLDAAERRQRQRGGRRPAARAGGRRPGRALRRGPGGLDDALHVHARPRAPTRSTSAPGQGPGRRPVRPRPLDEDRLPDRPQEQEGHARRPRRARRPAARTVATPKFLAVGGLDLLILDSKNVLWRWRPSNATGKGTLVKIKVTGSAARGATT